MTLKAKKQNQTNNIKKEENPTRERRDAHTTTHLRRTRLPQHWAAPSQNKRTQNKQWNAMT